MDNTEIKRIFILRPDNLGDLVLFSGALRHLRRHWPEAQITICVRKFGEEFFAHCPYMDRIVPYQELHAAVKGYLPGLPSFPGRDRLGALIRRCAPNWTVRRYRCDLAILPLQSVTAGYHDLMRQIPARIRIGICGKTTNQTVESDLASRPWYTRQWDASDLPGNFSELAANRMFLEFLGVDMRGQKYEPEFWTTEFDRQRASQLLGAETAGLTLALAPGVSSIPGRNLPPAWFARSLQNLSGGRLRVVLLGSRADMPLCQRVGREIAGLPVVGQVLNLAGQTTVGELIECLKRCDVVFSQETAVLHIATALHKPVLGIVGGGHFGRFYPWGDPTLARVVNKPMDCYGCNWRCIYDSLRCIQEIPPESATRELQSLIAALPPA